MTHRKRWGRLERVAQLYNRRQAGRVVQLLMDMASKAEQARAAAGQKVVEVLTRLEGLGITEREAGERMLAREAALQQPSPASLKLPRHLEYVQLRLRLEWADNAAGGHLPPASSLFDGLDQLAPGAPALGRYRARVRRLESDSEVMARFGGQRPAIGSQEMATVQLLDMIIPTLSRRPSDQKKLLKGKEQRKKQLSPLLTQLQGWLAGGYVGFDQLPAAVRLSAPPPAEAWGVDAICRGEYPWEAGRANAGDPPTASDPLITELRTYANEHARALEECELLDAEKTRCIAYFQNQHVAIATAIRRVHERRVVLQAGGQEPAPACSSFASRQPARPAGVASEVEYCSGLLLLLQAREHKAAAQLAAARAAFAGNGEHADADGDAGSDEEEEL
eukprot:scaffold34.g4520.t1